MAPFFNLKALAMTAEVTTPQGTKYTYRLIPSRWYLRGPQPDDAVFSDLGLDKFAFCKEHYPKKWVEYAYGNGWPMTRSKACLMAAMAALRAHGCSVRFENTDGIDIPKKLIGAILGPNINKFFEL